MDIEAVEYLKNKGFKYNDYTNEFKSITIRQKNRLGT